MRTPPPALRLALALLVLLTALVGAAAASPRPDPKGGELSASGRRILLPLIRNSVPPPPPAVIADLSIRPVPLRQVERGGSLSVEYRFRNDAQQPATASFSLFYPSRLLGFTRVDSSGDRYVAHDATRVIVEVRNVPPGQTRTGRINFLVFGSSAEGSLIGLFAEYNCRVGQACRSNFAEVEVIRNADEGNSGGTFNMSVSPDRGPPGTAHTFSGSRFRPGETFVTWLNTPTGVLPLSISGRADNSGRIQFTFGSGQLTQAGFYSMVAHGQQSNVQNVAPFIVQINGQPAALAAPAALVGGAAMPPAAAPAQAAPALAPAQSDATGGVAGQVRDGAGAGVAGVAVEVLGAAGELVAVAQSRADGAFFVSEGLATGQYTLVAKPSIGTGLELLADASAGPVSVTAPEITRGITLTLPAAGGLAGLVTAGGAPAAGVFVTAADGAGAVVGSDVTGADGRYSITHLPPGSYDLSFDRQAAARAGLYSSAELPGQSVTAGQIAAVPTVSLTASTTTGVIAGTVSDAATDAGIGDVLVVITPAGAAQGETLVSVAHTAADGSYTSDPLPAGSYRVQFVTLFSELAETSRYSGEFYNDAATFAESDPVSVVAGQQAVADAGLSAGGSIAGTVVGGDAALEGALVVALDGAGVPRAFAVTDAAGAYTLGGLRAGSYTVRAITSISADATARSYVDGGYDTTPATPDLTPVAVAAGAAVTEINIALGAGARIAGMVTAGDTGEPIGGVLVVFIRTAGGPALAGISRTDAAGTYSSPALAAGAYTIWFTTIFSADAATRSYQDEFFNNKTSLEEADSILVGAPRTTVTRNAELAPGGSVAGRVSAADTGAGLGGVFVVASVGQTVVGGAITDDGGAYSLVGLPAGTVSISFDPSNSSDPAVRDYAGQSVDVAVAVGGEAEQDVTLTLLP